MKPISREDFERLERANAKKGRKVVLLKVGEVVEVKGGRFRVESIGKRIVRLRGLPATHLAERKDAD